MKAKQQDLLQEIEDLVKEGKKKSFLDTWKQCLVCLAATSSAMRHFEYACMHILDICMSVTLGPIESCV